MKKITPVQLSEKNRLFAEYVTHFERVSPFFDFSYEDDWKDCIASRQHGHYARSEISRILLEQNIAWNAPYPVLENIKKLKESSTFVVATGQQAGVFSGPLYTIYKTITTLKLAHFLSERFSEFQFIPLFWMEVDDSDFKEINHLQYISKDNRFRRLELPEPPDEKMRPVFSRKIYRDIEAWRQILKEDFFPTEFAEEVLDTFFGAYQPGRYYHEAFAQLMLKFFGKQGLVLFNPSVFPPKKLVKTVFTRALVDSESILQTLKNRNTEIEKGGYRPQIAFREGQTLLFFIDEQLRRVRIDRKDAGTFLLNYPEKAVSVPEDDLLALAENETERFSPNVALRPLIQDSLFPAIAYVAGPAEIAYFAQLQPLYHSFDVTLPVIYPRLRVTIVENKIGRLVAKYRLSYSEILSGAEEVVFKKMLAGEGNPVLNEVTQTGAQMLQLLQNLAPRIKQLDPTLISPLEHLEHSINRGIHKLEHKIEKALENQNKTQRAQMKKLLLHLYPNHNYQERELNVIYFLIKYGFKLLDDLTERLPIDSRPHYLAEL